MLDSSSISQLSFPAWSRSRSRSRWDGRGNSGEPAGDSCGIPWGCAGALQWCWGGLITGMMRSESVCDADVFQAGAGIALDSSRCLAANAMLGG